MFRVLLPMILLAASCEPVPAKQAPPGLSAALAVSPEVVGQGQTVTFELLTADGPFEAEDLEVDLGDGLEVIDVWHQDAWHAFATVQVDPDAELGLRDVSAAAGDWSDVSYGAVRVIPQSFAIRPARAGRGAIVHVQLEGVGTDWSEREWPLFGEGVDVLDLVVTDPTHATALLGVAPDADVGHRDVTMGELVLHDGFTVDADVVRMRIDCRVIPQGADVDCAITGEGTDWEPGTVIELWDGGGHNPDVTAGFVRVHSETDISLTFFASNAARVGMRDLVVRTGDQQLLLSDAVEVTEVAPALDELVPFLEWKVRRSVDERERVRETGSLRAYFVVPLDPPCGGSPPPGRGPLPYDIPIVVTDPPPGSTADCPTPKTVDAGDTLLLRSESSSVVLNRQVLGSTGQVFYEASESATLNYPFGQTFDLVIEGTERFPAVELPGVLRTVPAEVVLTGPGYGPHRRVDGLPVSWALAGTYPGAILSLSVRGDLALRSSTGSVQAILWDDGEFVVPSAELSWLDSGDATVVLSSFVEGPEFGLPFSERQSSKAESSVTMSRAIALE